MEPDMEPDPEIIAEFKRRKTRQLIAVVPFVLAIIPLLLLDKAGPDGLFGIPSVVVGTVCLTVAIILFIFSLMNWRCPACKSYLGKAINPRFCQKCGAQLQ